MPGHHRLLFGAYERIAENTWHCDLMKIQYFTDSDTLLIALNERLVTDTRDLDQDTTLDVDARGQVVAITLEHASQRVDVHSVCFQQFARQLQ